MFCTLNNVAFQQHKLYVAMEIKEHKAISLKRKAGMSILNVPVIQLDETFPRAQSKFP
jgi:hypothetical protein